jgi:MFS family permease
LPGDHLEARLNFVQLAALLIPSPSVQAKVVVKRAFRIAVLSIFTLALTTVAIPAQAAEYGFYREQDSGRSAAIIGGSAAGALIGAAIGASMGGFIADQSVRHHDRR